MSSSDGEATSLANTIARSAEALNLALVEAASGVARRVAVENGGRNVVWAHAGSGDGVGDDEAALGVATESDLGVGALGLGLRNQFGHDRAALATHKGIASNGCFVVDTLNGDTVGAKGSLEGRGE